MNILSRSCMEFEIGMLLLLALSSTLPLADLASKASSSRYIGTLSAISVTGLGTSVVGMDSAMIFP
ncbi:MAG TPA: hypothetical protein VE089_09585 [Nitrososphaeraceae archaeon]|nr:hypothetical protein [Nitrososphaeraceae archaeon]